MINKQLESETMMKRIVRLSRFGHAVPSRKRRKRKRTVKSLTSSVTLPSIDKPENFFHVIYIFLSHHLTPLYADPERIDSLSESRSFRLCLQCIAYRIAVYRYETDDTISLLKNEAELSRLGFYPPTTEDEISDEKKELRKDKEERADLTELLDQARHLGLGQDVDNVTHACQLNMEIRKLASLSNDEADSGRWDVVLRYMVESVILLDQRDKAWPSWPDLEETRQQVMEPVQMYHEQDSHVPAEAQILIHLLRVSDNILHTHATDACKYIKFHSSYLDRELGKMAMVIAKRSADIYTQALGKLMTASNTEFCKLVIDRWLMAATDTETRGVPDGFDSFFTSHFTVRFSLRIYRLCLSVGEWDLADMVMAMRFDESYPDEKVTDFMSRLLSRLLNNPQQQPTNRITLNREKEDSTRENELPELLSVVEDSYNDIPWWVEDFRPRHKYVQPSQGSQADDSPATSATTVPPNASERRRFDLAMLDLPAQRVLDATSANHAAARMIITNNSIHDCDTYDIPYSHVPAAVENPITIKWMYRNVEEQKYTNMAIDTPYHCRILTYNPIENKWTLRSDMCKISGQLAVEKPGATCVPFLGDCGVNLEEPLVFKIHIPGKDDMSEYLADVRTQSTAAWYVNRFSKLTRDRFGYLTMLHLDLVIVYQRNSRRDSILELMTREHYFTAGSAVKFDKYTNNASYRNQKVNTDILEAFSHFTHHDSEGTLMVTDIQGWVLADQTRDNIKYTLTDPVIHCPGEAYRFGETNLRYEGFDKFFRHVHPTCNHICESLNLTRPEEYREPVKPRHEPDQTGRNKPGNKRSLPIRASNRPTNNPYKRRRQDSAGLQ